MWAMWVAYPSISLNTFRKTFRMASRPGWLSAPSMLKRMTSGWDETELTDVSEEHGVLDLVLEELDGEAGLPFVGMLAPQQMGQNFEEVRLATAE